MNIEIDITDVKIETNRLILRAFDDFDLDDFYEYASVEGVGEMAGWKHHASIEVSKMILDLFIREKKTFAIVYKDNNKVIGSLGIEEYMEKELPVLDDLRCREIGYVLSKEYWGKGIMVEAIKAVIEYCFEELKLDAITVGHFINNNQSRRVIEKCGFEYVKEISYKNRMDEMVDTKMYVLYRKDYKHD